MYRRSELLGLKSNQFPTTTTGPFSTSSAQRTPSWKPSRRRQISDPGRAPSVLKIAATRHHAGTGRASSSLPPHPGDSDSLVLHPQPWPNKHPPRSPCSDARHAFKFAPPSQRWLCAPRPSLWLTLCRPENAFGLCVHRVAPSPPRIMRQWG